MTERDPDLGDEGVVAPAREERSRGVRDVVDRVDQARQRLRLSRSVRQRRFVIAPRALLSGPLRFQSHDGHQQEGHQQAQVSREDRLREVAARDEHRCRTQERHQREDVGYQPERAAGVVDALAHG